jgi:hypothetical protein
MFATKEPRREALIGQGLAPGRPPAHIPGMSKSLDRDGMPRRPRAEPEIIPPDSARPGANAQIWSTQRVFLARPGPFARWLALLGLAAVVGTVLLVVLGLFLLALPLAGLLVAAYLIGRLSRPRPTARR